MGSWRSVRRGGPLEMGGRISKHETRTHAQGPEAFSQQGCGNHMRLGDVGQEHDVSRLRRIFDLHLQVRVLDAVATALASREPGEQIGRGEQRDVGERRQDQ